MAKNIEVYYTGGGIWMAEVNLENGTYATIDTDCIDCLTIYEDSDEEEKYMAEHMLYSANKDELDEGNRRIYNDLVDALNKGRN